jgi:integrase
MKKKDRRTYGTGALTRERDGRLRARLPDGRGKHIPVGMFDDTPQGRESAARRLAAARIAQGEQVVGTTTRQWGDAWLLSQQRRRSIKSITTAWNVVVRNAPFADDAIAELSTPDVCKWFRKALPLVRKQRSVRHNGKRRLVTLPEAISHTHALSVLAHAKRCFEAAKHEGLIDDNPIATVFLASPDADDDATDAPLDEGAIDYRTAEEIELILSCQLCAQERGIIASDIVALRDCPHMPFEQRVVFTLEIHQAPRQGELAGMDWERCDFARRGWTIAKSWNRNRTKTGVVRWQAWIPRAERALRAWWESKGCPTKGIVFPSVRGPRKRQPMGARAAFVLSCPESMAASEVVARAKAKGITLKAQTVHAYRSRARHRADASKPENQVRYGEGYDWAWADHKEKGMTRLGWPRRCGVRNPGRFHDHRDTAATHLLSGTWGPKWSIQDVSDHLGHTDIKVTQRRYAHVTKEARQTRAQSVESDRTYAANMPQACEVESSKYLKSLAPEVGLEPTTRRLTVVSTSSESEGLRAPWHIVGMSVVEIAHKLQEAVAPDAPIPHELCTALAEAVLKDRVVRLARSVRRGGPQALLHAIELAGLVVESVPDRVAATIPSARPPRRHK